jgi:hypothetical protein
MSDCVCDSDQCTAAGSALLAHPSLQYILQSEPVIGSHDANVASGPINRELKKLLANDCALATLFLSYFSRTASAAGTNAPVVDTIPVPLSGAPASPLAGAVHTVYYLDQEVVYKRDSTNTTWEEIARFARVTTMATIHRKQLEIDIAVSEDNIQFELPTTDDLDALVAFTIDDIKNFYVSNLVPESPFVGVLMGINEVGSAVRVMLTSAPAEEDDYKLIVNFEKIILA